MDDLKDEIFLRATYDYGINITSEYLKLIIEEINPSIEDFDRAKLKAIDEIVWTNIEGYNKQRKVLEIIAENKIIVNSDNKIACCLTEQSGNQRIAFRIIKDQ